jgi:L-threonylcarbamoyladenylate synthase
MGFLIKLSKKKISDINLYLEMAADHIIDGNLIAFPTNSVYGIGGSPLNLNLINKIYDMKYRDRTKGLLLLVYDFEEASKVAVFNQISKKLANNYWPGQLTLILERQEPSIIPPEVSAFQTTIGLRVPENEIIHRILGILKSRGQFGGIIGTSANFSGEPPAISGEMVAKNFLGTIDFTIDSGETESKIATTIVDCSTEDIKFLRVGKISEEEIREILEKT